jgi:hypothetical protein
MSPYITTKKLMDSGCVIEGNFAYSVCDKCVAQKTAAGWILWRPETWFAHPRRFRVKAIVSWSSSV